MIHATRIPKLDMCFVECHFFVLERQKRAHFNDKSTPVQIKELIFTIHENMPLFTAHYIYMFWRPFLGVISTCMKLHLVIQNHYF